MSRDAAGFGSMSKKTTRSGWPSAASTASSRVAREAGPRRDGEAREREHLVRLLPRREVPELVGADHEQRIVERLGAQQVDRARIRVEPHVVVRKRRPRKLEPVASAGA